MIAVFKAPGLPPELVRIDGDKKSIHNQLGGDFEAFPALKGAMILHRKNGPDLPYNIHFMGDSWHGPVLLVGRGEDDSATSLTPQLQTMLSTVLTQKEKR